MESTAPHTTPLPAPAHRQPGILRALAKAISVICHPVFLLPIMTLVMYLLFRKAEFKEWSKEVVLGGRHYPLYGLRIFTITLVTVFFPLFSVGLMKALGFVESIYLRTAKDRIIPLIATMIFYFWAYQVFSHLPDTPMMEKVLLLGSFWGIIVLFIGSIFFKISMHTTAAGGMVGVMIMLLFLSRANLLPGLLIALVIAGLIGTARLILKEHTTAEIWIGYFIGIVSTLGAWWYLA